MHKVSANGVYTVERSPRIQAEDDARNQAHAKGRSEFVAAFRALTNGFELRSVGLADPGTGLAIAYVMNRLDWRLRSPRSTAATT